ncbi:hypothetical protein BLA29_006545 [Euroglyphus maynei]|uniref:N-end aminoacyl transferase N-terminal domain-containing protein n=1 Tax=Euroglyphus maynei TaxID=6958 RepID=A0A1Y3AU32_EURMA|nr:hypothetical protein BLA29_006545 [Euroglyphus maynei]
MFFSKKIIILIQGLWAHYLPPRVYKGLIDRNWRRCGKYIYKPVNNALCCPLYTIRCDATDFKLTKSQKKAIKKFNNYIGNDIRPTNGKIKSETESMDIESERLNMDNIPSSKISTKTINMKFVDEKNNDEPGEKANEGSADVKEKKSIDFNCMKSEIKMTKKKYLRRQKLVEKLMKRENCSEERAKQILWEKSCRKQKTKTLEDYLSEIKNYDKPKHTFKTKIIRVKSKTDDADRNDYEVFKKYQMKIHKEKENEISYRSYTRFLIDSPLDVSV